MAADDRVLRLGTRGSALALWQADEVTRLLQSAWPGLRLERLIVRTLGDRAQEAQPADLGEVGLFTKELEQALLRGEVDLAVHSLKDLPTKDTAGLHLAAMLERADPRDALIGPPGATLASLPAGSRIGTSSLRRKAQVLAQRPDLLVPGLRGNVPTRLEKLARGEYDALIMAVAGLKRLRLDGHITAYLEPDELLSAPGQGAVAVQVRSDDGDVVTRVGRIDHVRTRIATATERMVLARLEAGCHAPVGALATWHGGDLDLRVLAASTDGTASVRRRARAPVTTEAAGRAFGLRLADDLLADGAAALLSMRPAREQE